MIPNQILRDFLPVGAGFALALLAGCATSAPTITSSPDKSIDYAGYKTFMMLKPSGLAVPSNPAVTPMLVRELRAEAGQAFAAKGLVRSSTPYADVMILVHGGTREKLEVQNWGLGYGRLGRGQQLDQYKEGTLLVDVFDAKSREMIWRGTAVAEIGELPDAARLKSTVDSIIARYPN